MRRFKSPGQAQRFPSAHEPINNFFRLRRDHIIADQYRIARARAFEIWAAITDCQAAA
jgi:putative transposase